MLAVTGNAVSLALVLFGSAFVIFGLLDVRAANTASANRIRTLLQRLLDRAPLPRRRRQDVKITTGTGVLKFNFSAPVVRATIANRPQGLSPEEDTDALWEVAKRLDDFTFGVAMQAEKTAKEEREATTKAMEGLKGDLAAVRDEFAAEQRSAALIGWRQTIAGAIMLGVGTVLSGVVSLCSAIGALG